MSNKVDPWVAALHPSVSDGSSTPPARPTLLVQGPGAPTVSDDAPNKQTILTFPNATVQTKTVDGASAPITKGFGAMMKNGKITLASSGALASSLYIAGIVLAAASANQQAQILTSGLVDPSVLNLGAGVACAVGLDTNGQPVRVTDSSCATGLKYVGACDANGAIYVAPRTTREVDVTDFGAVADSTNDQRAVLVIALARAITLGCTVVIPSAANAYKCVGALTLDNFQRIRGERLANATLGSTILFSGAGAGFVVGGTAGAFIQLSKLTIEGDSSSGHLFNQPTGQLGQNWLIRDCAFVIGNPAKGAIVCGASGDNQGIGNSWSKFAGITVASAPAQSVPIVQLYGYQGGLNTMYFDTCVFTGGGVASDAGTRSTAEMIRIQSTDANIIANMEFKNCGFEIPYAGAMVLRCVRRSRLVNCWTGDLGVTTISKPVILIGASPNTGGLVSENITITEMQDSCGANAVNKETIHVEGAAGQAGIVLLNSLVQSVNQEGPNNSPIISIGSHINFVVSPSGPVVGIDEAGIARDNVSQTAVGHIILGNGLNSDVPPQDFYSSLVKVTTTAIFPVKLGGLTMGAALGDGTRIRILYDNGTQPIGTLTIVNEDTSSQAVNRITTLTGADVVLLNQATVELVYDATAQRWILTDVGVPVIPFVASSIPGLSLDLNADEGVSGSPVSTWTNQAPLGGTFTASSTARPTVDPTGINGGNAISFDGVNDALTSTLTLADVLGSGHYTLFALVDYIAGGTTGSLSAKPAILCDSGTFWNGPSYNSNATPAMVTGQFDGAEKSTPSDAITLNQAQVHGMMYDGSIISATVDGGAAETASAGAIGDLTGTLIMGSNYTAANFAQMKVRRVLVWKAALTTAQRSRVINYLLGF